MPPRRPAASNSARVGDASALPWTLRRSSSPVSWPSSYPVSDTSPPFHETLLLQAQHQAQPAFPAEKPSVQGKVRIREHVIPAPVREAREPTRVPVQLAAAAGRVIVQIGGAPDSLSAGTGHGARGRDASKQVRLPPKCLHTAGARQSSATPTNACAAVRGFACYFGNQSVITGSREASVSSARRGRGRPISAA